MINAILLINRCGLCCEIYHLSYAASGIVRIEDGNGRFFLFRRRNCAVCGCGRSGLEGFGMQWDLLELGSILGLR